MDTIKIYAAYMPKFNAYCVSDEQVSKVVATGKTPEILLKDDDYSSLGGCSINAITVGFLMGRESGYYSIDYNYAKSIAQSGVRLKLLTYEKTVEQMHGIDGLILPGGAFSSPDHFYEDGIEEYNPNPRYEAYQTAIITARQRNIPILGICAGAQMIACILGGRLHRDVKQHTNIIHKSQLHIAHWVSLLPGNPLSKMFHAKNIMTNSRHREALKSELPAGIELYAVAEDGIPEAWGSEEKKILCIQWHPEDFAAEGNKEMQGIYNWLAQKASNK